MKKLIVCLLMLVCVFGFMGCGEKETPFEILEKGEQVKVGIIKYVTAPALDAAEKGIIEGLEEAGFKDGEKIKIIKYNPLAKASTLNQMAESAVKDCDIIFAIATPVAAALKAEVEKTGINVPILFTAVTDPVYEKLVDTMTNPGRNISGTTDLNPVADQLALINKMDREIKKIGVIYTSTENNSIVQINLLKAKAQEMGLEVVTKAISNSNDLKDATEALVGQGIDAIYLPTDNIVSEGAKTVLDITNEAKLPSICGEEGFLENGGTITLSINYEKLGKMTGLMAAKLFNNTVKDASSLPVEAITTFELKVNEEKANEIGVKIEK